MISVKKALHTEGSTKKTFSNLDEETLISFYVHQLEIKERFAVDIAASDGITMSNTYALYQQGWQGLAVEFDPIKFASLSSAYKVFTSVNLLKTKVFPENVNAMLQACLCPRHFGFLNLDIDSYEYFVLDELLQQYRPYLICLEINEKIPPPIAFTVNYDKDHFWQVDHFYGLSIEMAGRLCTKYSYDIIQLHYNNLFLVPKEHNRLKALTVEQAYNEGYRNKPDRKEKFPYNQDLDYLLTVSKAEAINQLHQLFEKYKGKYTLE